MDENELRGWVRAAQDDFNATQFLLDEDPIRPEVICFHAEQAAEKMLKAYLVLHGREVPPTQDCVELLRLCSDFDPEAKRLSAEADKLSGYQEFDQGWGIVEITWEELEKVLSSSEKILDYLEPKLQDR